MLFAVIRLRGMVVLKMICVFRQLNQHWCVFVQKCSLISSFACRVNELNLRFIILLHEDFPASAFFVPMLKEKTNFTTIQIFKSRSGGKINRERCPGSVTLNVLYTAPNISGSIWLGDRHMDHILTSNLLYNNNNNNDIG